MLPKYLFGIGAVIVGFALVSNMLVLYWLFEERAILHAQLKTAHNQNVALTKNNKTLEYKAEEAIKVATRFSNDYERLISSIPGSKEHVESVLKDTNVVKSTGGD